MPRIPTHKLNVAAHAIGLRQDFPDSEIQVGNGWIRWIGYLRPTPVSDRYKVKIEYAAGEPRPRVTVLEPELVIPAGKKRLPHVFADGKTLCLHFPGEWNPGMLISHTIVPWAAEWQLHYEVWRVTHAWTGGGHEPGVPKQEVGAESGRSGPPPRGGR